MTHSSHGPVDDAARPVVPQDEDGPILEVEDLNVSFYVDGDWFPAAIDVSYHVDAGEVLAIVGESGSGKTQSSMSLLGLLPSNGRATGSAKLKGKELVGLTGAGMRRVRGREIAVIFQEPMTALNPVYTIGFQIVETIRSHFEMGPKEARARAIELLTMVEIPEPERRFDAFPHQLSGGQRQRAMIAQALACEPQLLVADEPTTALDVTVQAEILKLMRDLRERVNAGVLLITHDMGVVADMADRIAVMQHGRIVESGTADQIFNHAQHPYTKQLLASVPALRRGQPGHGRRAHRTRPRGGPDRDPRADHGGGEPRPGVPQARQPAGLPCRGRRVPDDRPGRGRRPGGGVGLRQDHHRARGARPAAGHGRQARDRGRQHEGREGQGPAPAARARRHRLPGPRVLA